MQERLLKIMSDNNLSYEKMANSIGFSHRAVQSWVSGRNKPSVDAVAAICEAYDVSADWLLLGDNDTVVKLTCRCKDCDHWVDGCVGCTDRVKLCNLGGYMVGDTGYCVYADKRKN